MTDDLLRYNGEDRVISTVELQKQLDKDPKHSWTAGLGFGSLDKYIGGIRGGQLIILTGPTGEGKTLLCQSITAKLVTQGFHVCWFSYELPPQDFLDCFGSPDERPSFYVPSIIKGRSVSWIADRCQEAKLKYNTRIIFIDHLHFMLDMNMVQNTSLVLGAILRSLKQDVAVPLDIAVIIVAHMRKIDPSLTEPELHLIRDSSFCAQEADIALAVWRIKEESGEYGTRAVVKVLKARKTGLCGRKFRFIKSGRYLEQYTDDGIVEQPQALKPEPTQEGLWNDNKEPF